MTKPSIKVLLITENPLFMEVISGSLAERRDLTLRRAHPHVATTSIEYFLPDVIILDDRLASEDMENVMQAVRELPRIRLLLLNNERNDFMTLDARRMYIRKSTDLVQAILEGDPMSSTEQSSNGYALRSEAAEIRAGMFGLLAALCNQSPNADLVRRLRAIGVETLLVDDGNEDLRLGLGAIAQFLRETQQEDEEHLAERLAVDWTRLMRGVQPGYGPAPPYEAVHLQGGDEVTILKTVVGIYEENGAYVHENVKERPDYVGVELDFLRFLAAREANAWREGEKTQAQQDQDAGQAFISQHLGQWLPAYCDKAQSQARTAFYRGVIRLLRGATAETVASIHE